MTTKKSSNTLLLVFASLLVVAIGSFLIFPKKTEGKSVTRPLIQKKIMDSAIALHLSKNGDSFIVNLVKVDDTWKLALDGAHLYPTKKSFVSSFISELTTLKPWFLCGVLNGASWGIKSENSYSLAITNSEGLDDTPSIEFGKTDASGKNIYFQQSSDERIYRVRDSISPYLTTSASEWVDLDIFQRKPKTTDIQELLYSSPGDGKKRDFRVGRDTETRNAIQTLESITGIDITNLAVEPTEWLTVIYGDDSKDSFSLARLEDVWVVRNTASACAYIITQSMKGRIDEAFCLNQ
jgi:hypothetical protein